jgi:hypothetical protein
MISCYMSFLIGRCTTYLLPVMLESCPAIPAGILFVHDVVTRELDFAGDANLIPTTTWGSHILNLARAKLESKILTRCESLV